MICLKDVSKIYNQGKANETQALQHVTLTIKKGDMVAITGGLYFSRTINNAFLN